MITVVPEIEVPGHASALLAALPGAGRGPPAGGRLPGHPGLGDLPVPDVAAAADDGRSCATSSASCCGALPAPYVHIGGDECVLDSWRDDPEIDAYRRQRGLASAAELHAAFLREVADMLAARLRRPGGGLGRGLRQRRRDRPRHAAPDTIVMAWRGMEIARRAAEAGHDVIAAPVLPTYFDYYQSETRRRSRAGSAGRSGWQDVAAFSPVPGDWPDVSAPAPDRGPVPGLDRVHQDRPRAGVHDLPAGLRAGRGGLGRGGIDGRSAGAAPEGPELPAELAARLTAHLRPAGRRRAGVPAAGGPAAVAGGRHGAAAAPAGLPGPGRDGAPGRAGGRGRGA